VRAVLILVVLGTIALLVAWQVSRRSLARRANQKHIAELEAENARLDELLRSQAPQDRERR
jgi:cytochrome oxidase assembly protein ShyY1